MAKKIKKKDKVWAYLLKNKTATPAEVAKATGVSYPYVYKLMKSIGTPKEVFEAEARKEVASEKTPRFRSEVLFTAEELIDGQREEEHGCAHCNFNSISGLWSSYLGYYIDPDSVPMMLLLLKVARQAQNRSHIDNYVDMCGYAALAAEASKGQHED